MLIGLGIAATVAGIVFVAISMRPAGGLGGAAPAPGEPDPAWPTGLTVTRGEKTVLRSGPEPWLALGLTEASQATKTQPEGSIQIPPVNQPSLLGWYCLGRAATDPMKSSPRSGADCQTPVPGGPGAAVVLGHVNGGGRPGVFAKLGDVRKGDRIEITRSDGRTAFFVVTKATGTKGVDKNHFPTREVYGPVEDAQLRLITCGGRLDPKGHRYLDQIIVWASLDHDRMATS